MDLRDKSFDLMLGRGLPENHRTINRANGHQNVARAAYAKWGGGLRRLSPAADPTGSLAAAAENGREIRQIARELARPAAAPASGLRPPADAPSAASLYRATAPRDLLADAAALYADPIPSSSGAEDNESHERPSG